MMRARHRSVVGLISGAALAGLIASFVAVPAVADSTPPGVVVENIVNGEFVRESDEPPPAGWYWRGWEWRGQTGVARIVVDDSEPLHHDGSLHIATPSAGDWVQALQAVPANRTDGPTLQGLTAIGFDARAESGPAPQLFIKVDCRARASSSPEAAFTLTYAGQVPSDGTWQHVDAFDAGAAMWWSDATMNADGSAADASQLPTAGGLKGGAGSPHPISEYLRVCSGSLIRSYGIRQGTPGADGYVDNLRVNNRMTNFWVPVLTRLAGTDRRWTACEAAKYQFTNVDRAFGPDANPELARAVVVANQNSYADGLTAGPLANAVGGALLLSPGYGETGCLPAGVLGGPSTKVYLVGGTAVLDASVERSFREFGITDITRIGGTDRYTTAVKVARAIDALRPAGTPQQLFLASGTDFPDALSAGAPAGAASGAVLLTQGARMAPATAAYLASRPDAIVYAIGGPAAQATPLPASNELVGPNRYETATIVADRFFPEPSSAAFASGVAFPDALSAAAYGGHLKVPVILVGPDAVPNAVFAYADRHRDTLRGSVLLGGTGAVNRLAFDLLSSELTPR